MDLTCNSNCSCDRMNFEPVCDTTGTSYFSSCYAGCDMDFGNQVCMHTTVPDFLFILNLDVITRPPWGETKESPH